MRCMTCPSCGAKVEDRVLGLTKPQLKELFDSTIGPKGKCDRDASGLPGYMLFAKEIEKRMKQRDATHQHPSNNGVHATRVKTIARLFFESNSSMTVSELEDQLKGYGYPAYQSRGTTEAALTHLKGRGILRAIKKRGVVPRKWEITDTGILYVKNNQTRM